MLAFLLFFLFVCFMWLSCVCFLKRHENNSDNFFPTDTHYTLHTRHWIMMRYKNRCIRGRLFYSIFFFNNFWQIIWLQSLLSVYCFCVIGMALNRRHYRHWCIESRQTEIVPHVRTHTRIDRSKNRGTKNCAPFACRMFGATFIIIRSEFVVVVCSVSFDYLA